MATLWEIVTGNSSLSIDPSNTFWDHLNNQVAGDVFVGNGLTMDIDETLEMDIEETLEMDIDGCS